MLMRLLARRKHDSVLSVVVVSLISVLHGLSVRFTRLVIFIAKATSGARQRTAQTHTGYRATSTLSGSN